jgi:general secretion pathway protein A
MQQLDLLSYNPERQIRLSALGFNEDPFSTSADPRFLYLTPQHQDVLEKAQRAVLDRRGLLSVEGPIGIGKSTVARRLEGIFRMYAENFYVIFFVSGSNFSSQYEFLLSLSNECNLPKRKGLTGQWNEIEEFLNKQRKALKNVVIIIDDAERMDPSALDAIHRIYNYDVSEKISQVILFGQPELQDVFASKKEIRSRVYQRHILNPLSAKEAFNLINFRATVAGRSEPFLSQSGFVKIWEACGGIPRNLVKVCAMIVDEALAIGTKTIENEVLDHAIEQFMIIEQSGKRVDTTAK